MCWTYAHTASTPSVYFAYFDPYDYERQLDLVARCAAASGARVRSLGQTLDGRELDCVEVGHGPLHPSPNPNPNFNLNLANPNPKPNTQTQPQP